MYMYICTVYNRAYCVHIHVHVHTCRCIYLHIPHKEKSDMSTSICNHVQMNTSLLHPSGALLLEPVTRVVLEVKMANRAEPVPITFDTPADKVKGQLILVIDSKCILCADVDSVYFAILVKVRTLCPVKS